ncbi:Major Facilitator Superfamily protein [Rubripirellula amarantea]|uniref:Major Facilitator Superfamily protein n=1 Tax=Rubripirellula amarantea TaxID=2527999 RepID=A0A5C5WG19_9BACT|nr:MFS transporter [Rubripirellula amarantea]TWT49590.1 Major Facilitator Superfamily protein [Rubripirellula amarantea]
MHCVPTTNSQVSFTHIDGEQQNLRRSMGDAACFGGMVGCGETYFPAFALAVGLGETEAGLVASLPLLAGGAIQLISPIAIRWIGGLQRWIVLGAAIQAITFIPLAYAAWRGSLSLPLLLLIASVYWAAGLATGPAWNTWMETVVAKERRVRFFSKRSRLQQVCTFAGLLSAGMLLQWSSNKELGLEAFAAMFCIAGGLRIVSAGFLHRTTSSDSNAVLLSSSPSREATSPTDTISHTAIRLLIYLVFMQAFIQLSGPFFVPYMLKQLEFGYGTYVLLVSLAFVSKVLTMSFWGRVAERTGAVKVLWIGGLGLVPLASLWIVSTNVWWLGFIQIISGIAWSAYELGFFLMFFETLPASQRTRLLTYYNFANTLAICIGALAGAAILAYWGCQFETYYSLFAISSLGRLLCLGLLVGVVVPTHHLKSIGMRILSVRPGAGSIVSPVLASEERS